MLGNHHCHTKCLKLKNSEIKKLNTQYWSCSTCHNFPFHDLNNQELNDLSFNSLDNIINYKHIIHTDKFDKVIKMPTLSLQNSLETMENDIKLDFSYYHLNKLIQTLQQQPVSSRYPFYTLTCDL